MTFSYTAVDKAGKAHADVIEAASAEDAGELLRRRGLFVTEIKVSHAALRRAGARHGTKLSGGERLKALAAFSRQMAVLVSTGTPVVEAMASIVRQTPEGPWRDVLEQVRQRVEEGEPLSRAMELHPRIFDSICRSLIAAGESGGRLDQLLQRLASLTRQQSRVRTAVVGAMVYPSLLIVIAISVMGGMVGFVLPRFRGLFETLDATLPPTTQFVMGVSDLLHEYWWALLGGLVLVVVTLAMYLRTESGQSMKDSALVRAPLVGRVVRSLVTARVARLLGVLLEGRVSLLEALRLTRSAAVNRRYVDLLTRTEDAVTRGETVSAALASSDLIAPSVTEAIRSGERTGQIGPVLMTVADAMDEDNEVLIKTLTGVLEPLILVGLGLAVGSMAIGMFLPLFDLTSAAGPGGGAP